MDKTTTSMLVATLLATGIALAQGTNAPAQDPNGAATLPARGAPIPSTAPPPASQAAAGARIAAKGAGANAAPCSSCHGARGEGNAAANFPRIAGQSARYLARQLDAYASGERTNPVMTPIAKAMTAEQRQAAAAYYASLDPRAAGGAAPTRTSASSGAGSRGGRGWQLVVNGDERLQVQGCINCHGPGLSGEPPTYPYLASQHASYFREAMGQWKSGARNTDPSGQMPQIAKRLSDADVAALGEYLASLPAPEPLDAALAPARSVAPAARRSPSTPAASAGSTPQRGTGTSGEGPTTGGAQGPGGSQPPSGDRSGNPSQTSGSTDADPRAPSGGARR